MTHCFLTLAIPLPNANVSAVEAALDDMANRTDNNGRTALSGDVIHFLSLNVLPGQPARLLLEASGDGAQEDVLQVIVDRLGEMLRHILDIGGINVSLPKLKPLLRRHSYTIGQGLFSKAPGLCFTGTPGMSVSRIRDEFALAREVRRILEEEPESGTALQKLHGVRARILENEEFSHLIIPGESFPLLKQAAQRSSLIKLVLAGVLHFTWPYLIVFGVLSVLAAVMTYRMFELWPALLVAAVVLMVGLVVLVVILALLYRRLRGKEKSDSPDNAIPNPIRLGEIIRRENQTEQNHLFAPTPMKPGRLRRLTLTIVFWVILKRAAASRPGFLGDLGTIHFARWILLPGTNDLIFFSNYGGSWESYLEDFITKASRGLTGVWSNTNGFPRTANLFQEGASDGDRFKRWARRNQLPTQFWYSGYPHLTTDRIRINSAIRNGLASPSTEDEASNWLSQIGSRPPGSSVVEVNEVQTILFGGLRSLPYAACLFLRLPGELEQARVWMSEAESTIAFGDVRRPEVARLIALTYSGLQRLVPDDQILNEFPIAFREGMSVAHRAALLADTGDDKPESWWWGHGPKSVDVALIVYCRTADQLGQEVDAQLQRLRSNGGELIHLTNLSEIHPTGPNARPNREPFGFVDGVSQPIVRGTRRFIADSDKIHIVEPGEFILGYSDNRGYLPLTPTVPATSDPHNHLPGTSQRRDLGKNGTFLVVRQLEQDVKGFEDFLADAAAGLVGHPAIPQGFDQSKLERWLAAKMVGRWRDGTSLTRFPHRPGTGWQGERDVQPDNSFLLGEEDPIGHKCPFGAHIRRANPRESFTPGSTEQLAITNRHRILRIGRPYPQSSNEKVGDTGPGLMFMCVNADIERQFEFIQQTWALSRHFHGLDGEVDPIMGRGHKGGRLTIPTAEGPILLSGIQDFVTVRGGSYFFLPGRRALRFLSENG